MKDTFNRRQFENIEFPEDLRENVSSLLIPDRYLCDLENVCGDMELHKYLKYLVGKYRKFIALGYIPHGKNVRIKYQKKGQSLVNVKFRPWDEDWAELGILAYGLGVSRCWLFSYLLELEFSLLGEFLDLPEVIQGLATLTNSSPRNIWQFKEKKKYFNRVLHFKV
ncbi:MAG: DUF1564 family protein [Leptospiraceae bacterium]|nr:DUF1564 family protein [Leptospiraceae bacterium]